jgi:hypothetical protein
MLGSRRRVVRVRQPRGPLGQQILQFEFAEPRQRQIKPAELQLAELEAQQFRIPARPRDRKLIVGQHVGPLLRLAPARGDHHGDLGDAELPGGEHPGVAPAIRPPSSPTSAGVVQPHSLMLAAIAAI